MNTGEWLQLLGQTSGLRTATAVAFDGVEIYTIGGVLLKRIDKMDIDTFYPQALSQLPKGIYIVKDRNGARKYAKTSLKMK